MTDKPLKQAKSRVKKTGIQPIPNLDSIPEFQQEPMTEPDALSESGDNLFIVAIKLNDLYNILMDNKNLSAFIDEIGTPPQYKLELKKLIIETASEFMLTKIETTKANQLTDSNSTISNKEKWNPPKGRASKENASSFIRRVYADELNFGLASEDFLGIDEKLYYAYHQHIRRHPNDIVVELQDRAQLRSKRAVARTASPKP